MSDEELEAIAYLRKVRDKNLFLFCNDIRIVLNLITKQQKEIATLNKIAEKLASTTYDYANLEMLNICPAEYEGKVDLRKCKQNHIERNCIQCIIDWARKEVEK